MFLIDHGLPASVAAACLRQQLLSHVDILIGVSKVVIPSRTIGSLTGSRLAGLASRVPVQHLCCSRQRYWGRFGFRTPNGVLTMSTYVDNLFAAGKNTSSVSVILDDAEEFL